MCICMHVNQYVLRKSVSDENVVFLPFCVTCVCAYVYVCVHTYLCIHLYVIIHTFVCAYALYAYVRMWCSPKPRTFLVTCVQMIVPLALDSDKQEHGERWGKRKWSAWPCVCVCLCVCVCVCVCVCACWNSIALKKICAMLCHCQCGSSAYRKFVRKFQLYVISKNKPLAKIQLNVSLLLDISFWEDLAEYVSNMHWLREFISNFVIRVQQAQKIMPWKDTDQLFTRHRLEQAKAA
jgi:hypothetical protein